MIANQQSITSFAHHAIYIFEPCHSFNAATTELTLYLFVDIIREVVFNELNALKEGAAERKNVGLG